MLSCFFNTNSITSSVFDAHFCEFSHPFNSLGTAGVHYLAFFEFLENPWFHECSSSYHKCICPCSDSFECFEFKNVAIDCKADIFMYFFHVNAEFFQLIIICIFLIPLLCRSSMDSDVVNSKKFFLDEFFCSGVSTEVCDSGF